MKDIIINAIKEKIKAGKTVSVRLAGHSMSPTICNGDEIVLEPYAFEAVKENDVIAYCLNDSAHFIIHRVIRVEGNSENKYFITKGDNNQYIDAKVVKKDNFLGIVNLNNNKKNAYEIGPNVTYLKNRNCVVAYEGKMDEIPAEIMPVIKQREHKKINRKLTTELIILLSYRCNLNCVYCSNDSGHTNKVNEVVREENLVKAISYVVKNAVLLRSIKKDKQTKAARIIISGGGEPTVEWNLIVFIVDLVNKYKKQYGNEIVELEILTNAQVDNNKAEYLINNFDNIAISCDGFSAQDIQRPRVDNQSSLIYVKNFMEKLNQAKKRISIRMTVTGEALPELYNDIKYLIDTYDNIKDIVAEPYVQVGRGESESVVKLNYDNFIKTFDRIVRAYYEYVYNSSTILEYANKFPCQRLSGVSLVLSPYNVLTCCDTATAESQQWDKMFLSTLDGEIKIDKEYSHIMPPICEACIAEEFCAGGCPMHMSNLEPDEKDMYCYYRQEMMRDELLRRLELSKKTRKYVVNGKDCLIYELPQGVL